MSKASRVNIISGIDVLAKASCIVHWRLSIGEGPACQALENCRIAYSKRIPRYFLVYAARFYEG